MNDGLIARLSQTGQEGVRMHILCTYPECGSCGNRPILTQTPMRFGSCFLEDPGQLNACKKLSMIVLNAASFFRLVSIFRME